MHGDAMNSLMSQPSSQNIALVDHPSSLPNGFSLLPFTATGLPIPFNLGFPHAFYDHILWLYVIVFHLILIDRGG